MQALRQKHIRGNIGSLYNSKKKFFNQEDKTILNLKVPNNKALESRKQT